jgi:hypothetical protein
MIILKLDAGVELPKFSIQQREMLVVGGTHGVPEKRGDESDAKALSWLLKTSSKQDVYRAVTQAFVTFPPTFKGADHITRFGLPRLRQQLLDSKFHGQSITRLSSELREEMSCYCRSLVALALLLKAHDREIGDSIHVLSDTLRQMMLYGDRNSNQEVSICCAMLCSPADNFPWKTGDKWGYPREFIIRIVMRQSFSGDVNPNIYALALRVLGTLEPGLISSFEACLLSMSKALIELPADQRSNDEVRFQFFNIFLVVARRMQVSVHGQRLEVPSNSNSTQQHQIVIAMTKFFYILFCCQPSWRSGDAPYLPPTELIFSDAQIEDMAEEFAKALVEAHYRFYLDGATVRPDVRAEMRAEILELSTLGGKAWRYGHKRLSEKHLSIVQLVSKPEVVAALSIILSKLLRIHSRRLPPLASYLALFLTCSSHNNKDLALSVVKHHVVGAIALAITEQRLKLHAADDETLPFGNLLWEIGKHVGTFDDTVQHLLACSELALLLSHRLQFKNPSEIYGDVDAGWKNVRSREPLLHLLVKATRDDAEPIMRYFILSAVTFLVQMQFRKDDDFLETAAIDEYIQQGPAYQPPLTDIGHAYKFLAMLRLPLGVPKWLSYKPLFVTG